MNGLLVASVAALSAISVRAVAAPACGERDAFIGALAQRYVEQPAALGLAANGSVIEVLVSESGSWTIMVTAPSGTSCAVAAGEAFQSLPLTVAGTDS